jgi:Phage minor structural protein GP20.
MALEWLKTILGTTYTEDIDKKVSDEIGKGFVARADFNAANEAKKTAETTLKERDTQLDNLKKLEPEKLQAEINRLQGENKAAQDKHDTDLKQLKLDTAIDTRLIKEGAVNTRAVKALLDTSKISLDGDNLVGIDDQLKPIKEAEKWAFGVTSTIPKSGQRQNPSGGGSAAEPTVADEITAAVFGKTP